MSQPKWLRDSPSGITSPSNDQIRFVKSLYRTNVRRKERLFAVEGVRLLEEALDAGARPELVLVAPDQLGRTPRGAALLERTAAYRCLAVTEPVLKSLSDTVTPQGIIAVFPIPAPPEALNLGPVTLILDHLRDPGNAGTLLRSAEACGVVRTVAFVDSVDAYAPKVVRAAMGAHFRLAILEDIQWPWLRARLGSRPVRLAVAKGGASYDRVDWTRDCALILGGEAEGAGPDAEKLASQRVTIPMAGPTESLNAAMAGTILLFEAARERNAKRDDGSLTRPAPARAAPAGPAAGRSPAPAPGGKAGPRAEDHERRAPKPIPPRGRAPASSGAPRRPPLPGRAGPPRPRDRQVPGKGSGSDAGQSGDAPTTRPPHQPRPDNGPKAEGTSFRTRRRPKL